MSFENHKGHKIQELGHDEAVVRRAVCWTCGVELYELKQSLDYIVFDLPAEILELVDKKSQA